MDSIRQPTAFRAVAGLRRSAKTLPQTEAAPIEGYGHCLAVDKWSHPLQLLGCWRNYHGGEVLLRHRQNAPTLVNRKEPILLYVDARPHVSQMTLQRLNELAYKTLPYPAYSPDLSPTDYHFFKHLDNFLQEKVFSNQNSMLLD
uniref:Histone-lysine N-methyltransferase SETMAR n=1 Tax=Heterorhabditis bacteriophora TaxID=37862 RepID=A0A1I7WLN1_HETBA